MCLVRMHGPDAAVSLQNTPVVVAVGVFCCLFCIAVLGTWSTKLPMFCHLTTQQNP